MGTVAPLADRIMSESTSLEAVELMQKLSVDTQRPTTPRQVSEPTKKYAPVESGTLANGLNKPFERSTTPFRPDFMDSTMFYSPSGYPSSTYYYGGYDGSVHEWDRYMTSDGVEVPAGLYGDYNHGYAYAPYGAYTSSGSSIGHDGLYGPQHYQYPTSYYQSSTTSGSYNPNQAKTSQTVVAAGQVPLSAGSAKGHQNNLGNVNINRTNTTKPLRPSYQNSSSKLSGSYGWGSFQSGITSSGYQDPRFGFNGIRSSSPWLDGHVFSDRKPKHAASAGISSTVSYGNNLSSGKNQNTRPPSHVMALQPRATSGMEQAGCMDRMYLDNRMYGQYTSAFRSGSNSYDTRIGRNSWMGYDSKYKPRGRGNGSFVYGNESMDGLAELNRGPRSKSLQEQKDSEPITVAVKNGNNNDDNLPLLQDKEQYNKEDFPETYSDANFFVIKSYSEDDVHKSIKYGMWASTPNGNQKLDIAYKNAKDKSGECPVFLLFSVNASGQFVGLAEMVDCVDFNKSLEYWQQDKWTGCFPVKWHIVKDVPNSLLRHITLENNENKPVTNSRDTQEVGLQQGIEVLKIFKGHASKTCILDDFDFYEGRQKTMQERKAKQWQLNKQVGNEKPLETLSTDDKGEEGSIGKERVQMSVHVASATIEDPVATTAAVSEMVKLNTDLKKLEGNELVAATEDAAIISKTVVAENKVVSNGLANAR